MIAGMDCNDFINAAQLLADPQQSVRGKQGRSAFKDLHSMCNPIN